MNHYAFLSSIEIDQSLYKYFDFDVGSDEYNNLIDDQEFEFVDFSFGLRYKVTKNGDQFEEHRGYICTPLIDRTKRPNVSQPIQGYAYFKSDHRNLIIICCCTGIYTNNP